MPKVEVHDEDSATNVTPTPTPSPRRMSQLAMRRITRPSQLAELVEGTPVGEYEIQSQIGEGAMGTVYSAVHPLIGKMVAVKVLKPELCANQASLDRFLHEAQAVNKIGHPNIVDVFSFNELPDGRVYFVMEWLRGEDLKVRLSRGPMAVEEACDVLDGIARALEAAHAKQIVHRDLKPDNVFLHRIDNGPVMVKLLDFGIAKLVKQSPGTEKTQTGNMLGTPRYISPEQARGVNVDYRSDIYSLGVMAYETLAGRAPFQGETAMDIVVQHMSEPPPALSLFAKVPKPLEQCVMRMLEKDPANRPTLEDVRAVLHDPQRRLTQMSRATTPVSTTARPQLRPRRWPIFVGAALGAVLLGVGTWWLVTRAQDEPHAAAVEPAPPVTLGPPAVTPPTPPKHDAEVEPPTARATC
jgi:serine/threonine protein kinase